MLAGSMRASMFSPARIWPVSKSISSHARAPVGTGAGGTGIAAAGAGCPGCGSGVWAEATATRAALAAASRIRVRRKAETPAADREGPGGKGDSTVTLLVPDHTRFRQFQRAQALVQLVELARRHRTHAHTPQVAAPDLHVVDIHIVHAGLFQAVRKPARVRALGEAADLQGYILAGDRGRGRRQMAGGRVRRICRIRGGNHVLPFMLRFVAG